MDSRQRNTILIVLFIGVLMGALDIAIVGPALPAIRMQYQLSERSLSWIFSIYVLFNLIGTPLMAKLSDQFGRRNIYVLDVSLFAAGSLIVALAPGFSVVLLGRAIQGFGAGGIFPVASAVIGDTFPPEKRGGALGLIGAVFGLAFLIGPILGGVILSLASWRWLFLINLPIALFVITLSLRLLPSARQTARARFDWAGGLTLTAMLAALALAFNRMEARSFFASLTSISVLPFLVAALILFLILQRIERRVENPIVPPGLFDRRQLRLTYALSSGAGFAEAALVFLPLLAVASLAGSGVNEKNASWMLLPVVLAMAAGAPISGRLLDRLGSRTVILSGAILLTLGMVLVGLFTGSFTMFILSTALIGAGLSALLGAPLRYIMLNEARVEERSIAQGVVAIFTSAGQLLGSALTGAMVSSRALGASAVSGYTFAFLVIAAVSFLLTLMALRLKNSQSERETVRANQAAAQPVSQPFGAAK